MKQDREQRGFVVPILGMHRCGTSMVTRILNLLGLELGGPLQGSGNDNPHGFWEHRLFQRVNMEFLGQMGLHHAGFSGVARLEAIPGRLENADAGSQVESRVSRAIAKQFTQARGCAWGFKDPRSALTWPLWAKLLKRLHQQGKCGPVRPVVVVRHPSACLQSLLRRGDVARIYGQPECPRGEPEGLDLAGYIVSLWVCWYRLILTTVDMDSALVLIQEDLIGANAVHEIRRVANFLCLDESRVGEALGSISRGSDHRESGPDPRVSGEAQRLYDDLRVIGAFHAR